MIVFIVFKLMYFGIRMCVCGKMDIGQNEKLENRVQIPIRFVAFTHRQTPMGKV